MKPAFNHYFGNFSSRYVLGIEGVAPSMQNAICPVVTTVTSRPYYWCFFTWAYYDYYRNHEQASEVFHHVNDYIKKTNYYIACGALLNGFRGVGNFVGSDSIDSSGLYKDDLVLYREQYVQGLSTMQYYNPGVSAGFSSMNLVLDENIDTGERYENKKMSYSGEMLAKAFDKVIGETVYYQKYRFNTSPVPHDVLVELGKAIRIDMSTLPECRELLKEYLFERDRLRKLQESKKYLDFIWQDTGNKFEERRRIREFLFDRYSSVSEANPLPDEFKEIAGEWEVVIGRHYFTVGLQMIWKYLTEVLTEPMDLETWINTAIDAESAPFALDASLDSIISEQNFDHAKREFIVETARRTTRSDSVWNGIRLLLSIYNRFHDRNDLSSLAMSFYYYGNDDNSISMNHFFEKVDEYKEKPIREFVVFVMEKFIVRQHMDTAFMKMIRNKVDGFYVEKIGSQYRRLHVFDFAFQGIRLEQLASVMKDLRCF